MNYCESFVTTAGMVIQSGSGVMCEGAHLVYSLLSLLLA